MFFKLNLASGEWPRQTLLRLTLFITVAPLFYGCASTPAPTTQRDRRDAAPAITQTQRGPQAVIYADDAMLRKPYAVIGGTVENTSGAKLEDVSIEMELQKRSDGSKERRTISVTPTDLAPGERGTYTLRILSAEWSDSRIVSLQTGAGKNELVFRTERGARRPPERLPDKVTVRETVEGPKPKRRSGSDEFINSPDDPVSVP